ncbi:MAG: VOC family protein [Hyphomicrobiales bacterium]
MTSIKVKQVAHVCIFAHDIDETKAFYKDILGLEPVFNFTRDDKIFGFYLDAGNRTFIEVFQNENATYADKNNINHLCLEVENLEDAAAHIKAQNVDITPIKKACDDTYQAWIADPNGVKIELFEYTDKSAQFVGGDRVADW